MTTIRDHFWIWGHEAGSHNNAWNLPATSRMTPAEGAFYLDVPNILMITYSNHPEPPFDQYLTALKPLKRVKWSIVGDGSSDRTDLQEVISLSGKFPNLTGAIMDDFFHPADEQGRISRVSVEDLKMFRTRLHSAVLPLDLFMVVYVHDLLLPIHEHVEQVDGITFWTWTADQLVNLETNFARLEAIAPAKRKLLGCYLWDYGAGKPMPIERMQYQCETGLRWLREGRIEGMIFLASCICDLELETVEWTRQWIKEVGDQTLT